MHRRKIVKLLENSLSSGLQLQRKLWCRRSTVLAGYETRVQIEWPALGTYPSTPPVTLEQVVVADALAVTFAISLFASVFTDTTATSHGNYGDRVLRELTSLFTVSCSDLQIARLVGHNPQGFQQPYHISDGGDGIFLANSIDKVLDPGLGLDECWDNSDADADMSLDGGTSVNQSDDRDLEKRSYVDGSTNISQVGSQWSVLATGNSRMVVARPRNQLVHSGIDREGR